MTNRTNEINRTNQAYRTYKTSIIYIALFWLLSTCYFLLSATKVHAAVISKAPNNLGLVDYWSFNEGGGMRAGDSAGSQNHGTLSGSMLPSWVNGKKGGALYFDGSSSRVNLGSVNITASTTVSAWIKTTSAGQVPIFSNRGNGLYFGMTGGKFFVYYNTGTPSPGLSTSASVNNNTWRHVVWTSDGSTSKLYVDGVLDNTVVQARAAQSGTAYIGYDNSNNEYFPGYIDEVRVYNTTLSASDVRALYQAGQTVFNTARNNKSTNGLIALWSFNSPDISGNTVYDRSGGVRNLNLASGSSKTVGKVAQGISFSGVSQNASSSGFTELGTYGQQYSFSVWVKPARGETDGNVIHVSAGSNGLGWCIPPITLVSGKARANSYTGSLVSATSVTTITSDRWHHLVMTWDPTGLKIYVNGVLENTATQSTYSASGLPNYVWLSQSPGTCLGNAGDYDGGIDEVRVYNKALSASEVYNLYFQNETKINSSQNSRLNSGLVGLWSFNGPDYDSSSSTAEVLDASGSGNRANNISATLTQGKVGQALNFNGSSAYVSIPDSNSLDTTSVTVSAWVKANSWSDVDRKAIFIKGNAYYMTVTPAGKVAVYGYGKTSTGYHLSNATLSANEWYHIAMTIDDNGFKIYINGSLDNTITTGGTLDTSTAVASIGAEFNGVSRFFNGKIDEVRVYNRVLSATEIKQLYDMAR